MCGCGVPDIDINGDGVSDCGFWYGDISGDGQVTAYDAALTAQCVQGLAVVSELQRYTADVNGDGCVSRADVDLIAQYAVGLITSFPIDTMQAKPTQPPICNCQ